MCEERGVKEGVPKKGSPWGLVGFAYLAGQLRARYGVLVDVNRQTFGIPTTAARNPSN